MHRVWLLFGAGVLFLGCQAPPAEQPATISPAVRTAARVWLERLELELRPIPAGSFWMGSGSNERGRDDDEGPRHRVDLPAFWLGRTEVTCDQYLAFLRHRGASFEMQQTWLDVTDHSCSITRAEGRLIVRQDRKDHPITMVTYSGATAFCDWLAEVTGWPFRLPTEAEWERAARGGLDGRLYPWGDEPPTCHAEAANGARFGHCVPQGTVSVGAFAPNGFDLLDMAGNVYEWCADRYHPYGQPPPQGSRRRVLRGGGWSDEPACLRVASRRQDPPDLRGVVVGFRVACGCGSTVIDGDI